MSLQSNTIVIKCLYFAFEAVLSWRGHIFLKNGLFKQLFNYAASWLCEFFNNIC